MAKTPGRKGAPRRKSLGADGLFQCVAYTPNSAARIIERLVKGECWSHFCNEKDMPSYNSLYVWRRRHPEFAEAVQIAKEMAADRKADKALDVAEGAEATLQGDRLRVSTLMQQAALEAPHLWGGKAPAAGRAEPAEVVFYMRNFEKVIGPDGKAFMREIPREGEA